MNHKEQTVWVSFGIKFDIMFKQISINVLTSQFISGHASFDGNLVSSMKIPDFPIQRWGRRNSEIH